MIKKSKPKKIAECRKDPWEFLTNYIYTQDPILGVRPFPQYEYLKALIEATHREQYLLVPKSRQMMVSWTMLAYIIWSALFYRPGLYLVLSRNERCSA